MKTFATSFAAIIFALFSIILLAACGDATESNLPEGVEYSIIDEDQNKNIKKTNINIRVNKKVKETTLKIIAKELKAERTEYENLWIFYYLSDMNVGSGAWATSHYSPGLKVQIFGSTQEEDEATSQNEDIPGEVFGKWRSNKSLMGAALIIYKVESGKLFMQINFKSGNPMTEELSESTSNGLKRYDYENTNGEYYLIEQNGNLGMYDSDGKYDESVIIK
jgi:hypothetical protein